jgi:small-conductance mechanosensitive channel
MPFKMQKFIFWTGIYDAVLALTLTCPPFYHLLGLNIPTPFWAWLFAGFLAFFSAILILASRLLHQRSTFVYYGAILRYIAALLLVSAGLFGDLGLIVVPLGLADLAIGLVYMIGLTKEMNVSHRALFFDQLF